METVIGTIKNEDPNIHWGFFKPEGKVVLDLGCGVNNNEFMPTPMWFIMEKKASKVYGVDSNPQSYNWFKQNYNVYNFISFMDMVDSTEKFNWYIGNVQPQILKIDVEGSEIMLNAIKPELLESVEQIGIEYHNLACKVSCEHILDKAGFTIEYLTFDHLPLHHQGVIYAYKQK